MELYTTTGNCRSVERMLVFTREVPPSIIYGNQEKPSLVSKWSSRRCVPSGWADTGKCDEHCH